MLAAGTGRRRVGQMWASRWLWHLDEVFVRIIGVQHYLWPAVDHEGEVLGAFVSKTRDRKTVLDFLGKLMKRHSRPEEFVTDEFRSDEAALKELGVEGKRFTDH